MKVRAFAPGNISCIFKPIIGKDAEHIGSIGLGFTINEGVLVEVSLSKRTEIFFNGEKINFPTISHVVDTIITDCHPDNSTIKVDIVTPLPLGCGFGISGASALATAYALSVLLNFKKEFIDLAKIVHVAEVENGTGLGDVVNQYLGGCLLKIKPSYLFEATRIALDGSHIYCRVFSSLETKSIISDISLQKQIEKAADMVIGNIEARKKILLSDIITISKQFAEYSGLLRNYEVKEAIAEIEEKGGFASMIMLGNAVWSSIPFEGAKEYIISNNKAIIC